MATSEDQAQILEAAQGDDEHAEIEATPEREVPEAELHADDTPEQPEQEPAEPASVEPSVEPSEQLQEESGQAEEMAEPSGETDVAPQEAPEISEPPAEPTPDIDEPVPQTDVSPVSIGFGWSRLFPSTPRSTYLYCVNCVSGKIPQEYWCII